jgi:hypothetical protein
VSGIPGLNDPGEDSPNHKSGPQQDAQLEEYRSLREEILRRFNFRLLSVGYTNALIGGTIAVAANMTSDVKPTQTLAAVNNAALGILYFAYAMAAVGAYFTSIHTKQIYYLAAYIRREIEPKVTGLRWETWSQERRLIYSPTRTSPFALLIYYIGVDLGITALCFVLGIADASWRRWAVLAAGAIVALVCIFPLLDMIKLYGKRDKDNYLLGK